MPTSSRSAGLLVVASAGGHLLQARELARRLSQPVGVWATYGVPQARALLRGEEVVYTHHPTTKHLPNAVRNYRLARRVLAEHEVERVVSTGAAVAVPFLLRASRLGIPCHYIESATRVDAPSLTGRILERVPGVRLYAQHRPYNRRWRRGPSVFDGYQAGASAEAPPSGADAGARVARVLVSLGTHHFPFHQLVSHVRDISRDWEVLWQLGSTPAPGGLPGRVVEQLSPEELEGEVRSADVVVGHAGVGFALTALSLGKVPVLVPRRRSRNEHTDDHQVQLARELDRRGLAVAAEVGELTRGHLERAAGLVVTYEPPPPFRLAD